MDIKPHSQLDSLVTKDGSTIREFLSYGNRGFATRVLLKPESLRESALNPTIIR